LLFEVFDSAPSTFSDVPIIDPTIKPVVMPLDIKSLLDELSGFVGAVYFGGTIGVYGFDGDALLK